MKLLARGMAGPNVRSLQRQLNKVLKGTSLKDDGIFGDKTDAAVRKFQKSQGLRVDGIVGRKTKLALATGGAGGGDSDLVPGVVMKVQGKKEEMKKPDYDAGKQQILKDVKKGLLVAIRNRASECRILYDHYKELNKDQWIVSGLIHFTSGTKMPPESLISQAEAAAGKVEAALSSGDLPKLEKALQACEAPLNAAVNAMRKYQNKVLGSSENWVTGLEITKTTSFAIVSTWATAGAGSVAAAAYAGGAVSLLQASSGQVGKLIANPSKAPTLNDLWGIALDTGTGALGAGFAKGELGKKIISGTAGVLAKKLGGRFAAMNAKVLEGFVARTLQNVGASTIEEAIVQAFKQMKAGAKWSDFYKAVATKMMSSAVFGPFEEAAKATKLSPTLVDMISKKNKEFFTVINQGSKVVLTNRKATEMVTKFMSGTGAASVDKLVLEPVCRESKW